MTISDVDSGLVQLRTSTGQKSVSLGFQPDFVRFTVCGSITSLTQNNSTTDDYGWMHGAVVFDGGPTERVLFSGTGSNSTNGQSTETDNSRSINVLELSDDGNGINGRIQANAIQDSSGFTLDFTSTQESDYILYEAYSFTTGASAVDIDFFTARTSTGTQSLSTGFEPSFVTFLGQPRATSSSDTVSDGSAWGISRGWINGASQYSMAFASYSNNVDDHVWGARNDSCLLVKHQSSKGGSTGETEASGTIVSNGVDLNYSSVDGTGEAILYIAFDTGESWNLESRTTPTSASDVTVSGNYRFVNTVANATIDDLNSSDYPGSNQDAISYGWSYSSTTGTSNENTISMGGSSNSINSHRWEGTDANSINVLYTDANGNDDGSNTASISNIGSTDVTYSFSEVASGNGGVASSHQEVPFITYGPTAIPAAPSNVSATAQSNSSIEIQWTDNSGNEDNFNIYQSTSSGSSKSDYTLIDTVSKNTTSYISDGLTNSTKYYYRVSAENSAAESPLSNEQSTFTNSTEEYITWETELDWDSARSENNVQHSGSKISLDGSSTSGSLTTSRKKL